VLLRGYLYEVQPVADGRFTRIVLQRPRKEVDRHVVSELADGVRNIDRRRMSSRVVYESFVQVEDHTISQGQYRTIVLHRGKTS